MFKEAKNLEYVIEIIRAFNRVPGEHDAKYIASLVEANGNLDVSTSYIAKVLPKMKKANLLTSSDSGYKLSKKVESISVKDVLNTCTIPEPDSILYALCCKMLDSVCNTLLKDIYDI